MSEASTASQIAELHERYWTMFREQCEMQRICNERICSLETALCNIATIAICANAIGMQVALDRIVDVANEARTIQLHKQPL